MQDVSENPNLSLIVAMTSDGAIGKDNRLLWHLSDDLKRFKAITSGHTILMGRKTYESFPRRPLPNRFHIVLSNSAVYDCEQVRTVRTPQEALSAVPKGDEAFVIGGGQIYRLFLPYCRKAYITEVQAEFEADTYFPTLDPAQWELAEAGDWQQDPAEGLKFRYVTYVRK